MSFLYTILIAPLELLFEVSFIFFQKALSNYGFSIVGLSLIVTVVTLPLYHVAERIQQKEREQRRGLEGGVQRIKETFKGDEQFMMLSTYYRQNNYHPAYVLRGSLGLLIQVPFFIAAYHFLSNLDVLQGSSLSIIRNLGAPDQLIKIGDSSINLLPILMTIINIISGIIYTRGFALRDKIQLYGMAGLFLILLYDSPAGLVLYWTLNNFFSLIKNIFYKMKRPLHIAYLLLATGATLVIGYIWIQNPLMDWVKKGTLLSGWLVVVSLPILLKVVNKLLRVLEPFSENVKAKNSVFYGSLGVLFLLFGLVIPSNLIYSSVIEFSNIGGVGNPLLYVLHTLLLFLGMWVVWPLFLYALSNKNVKTLLAVGLSFFALSAAINVFLFPGKYGVISHLLQFEDSSLLHTRSFGTFLSLLLWIPLGVFVIVLLSKGRSKIIQSIFSILILGLLSNGIYSSVTTHREYREYSLHLSEIGAEVTSIQPRYHFSREGKNVLIIFLDRGMSSFFPFILDENPEVRSQLSGFVFYPNTVSFGNMTLYGAPPMFGGYEYTPDEINKRTNERLVDKHNEALLVLPRLFLDSGYSVTLNDPPFSNYKWEGDFTPFNAYPELDVLHHIGAFTSLYKNEHKEDLRWKSENENVLIKRYLPMFSFLRSSLPLIRGILYDDGRYLLNPQHFQSFDGYLASYAHLYYLRELSAFNAVGDVYINVNNDTTHDPIRLQTPEYEPRTNITNSTTPLDGVDGVREVDRLHYYVNVAALKRIGLWMDQLREEGVYDNTRIIIVSDHGRDLYSAGMTEFEEHRYDYNGYVPLFLTKDFNSSYPLRVDDTFMTNADAALLAIQDLTSSINPFTGKDMYEQVAKNRVNVYTGPFDPRANSGTRFASYMEKSFSIGEDIFVEDNWGPVEVEGAK